MKILKSLVAACVGVVALAAAASATNSVSVVSPGLNSTGNKLQVNVDDNTNNAFVRSDEPSGETHYLCRFWVDPTGLDLAEGNAGVNHVRFLRFGDNEEKGDIALQGKFLVGFITKSSDDHGYHMIFWARQDGATSTQYNSIANLYIGNEPRQVEIEFWAEDSGVQSFRFESVGVHEVNRSNLNMGDSDVDTFDFGVYTNGNPSLLSGKMLWLDEFESYR